MYIGCPKAAVPPGRDPRDASATRENGAHTRPRPEEGGGREDRDVIASGEHEVLLARGVVQDCRIAQDDVACEGEWMSKSTCEVTKGWEEMIRTAAGKRVRGREREGYERCKCREDR